MSEQTAMCPRHGVAHGVCVDPVKTTTEGLALADPPPSLAKAMGLPEEATTIDDNAEKCLAPSRCVIHAPNRFDPYEALDRVEQIVEFSGTSTATRLEGARIIYALRAYITGMER